MGCKVADRTESKDKKKYTHSGTVAQEVDLLFINHNVPGFRKEMGPVPCSQLASHIYIALRSLIGSQWATMNLLFNDNKSDKKNDYPGVSYLYVHWLSGGVDVVFLCDSWFVETNSQQRS